MIKVFADDFERFYEMLIRQIDTCPDEIWAATEGGYPYWMQILHMVGITELYTIGDGEPNQVTYGKPVIMFREEPKDVMSKQEMKELALNIRETARRYLNRMSPDRLLEINTRLSERLGREITQLGTLIAMIRHLCYHIGCCDTVLRNHGIEGVY